MQGESPLNMMRPQSQRLQPHAAAALPRRKRFWAVLLAAAIVVALAGIWSLLWYYAASAADHTLAGWVTREAAAGRIYSCGAQGIGGFPFRIEAHCVAAAARINKSNPPFAVTAKDITFAAQVLRPTLLIGHVTGPLTVAELGQSASYVADWSSAQMSVRGLPPDPDSFSVAVDHPHVDRTDGANSTPLIQADSAKWDSRIIGGSASNNPVIRTTLRFTAVRAPSLHPLLAEPLRGEIEAVLHGFKDLAPKSWAERFREMQAGGGEIEIKSIHIERADATVIGTGSLTVNPDGKLEGLIRVAIAGIDRIIPQLGLDKAINKGLDQLAGGKDGQPQGTSALDRLLPGLSDVVRDTTNDNLIANFKKMGQATEIDKKPAIVLPLRFSDGSVYLGMIPLGDVPPLF